jgi:hypothetical protein
MQVSQPSPSLRDFGVSTTEMRSLLCPRGSRTSEPRNVEMTSSEILSDFHVPGVRYIKLEPYVLSTFQSPKSQNTKWYFSSSAFTNLDRKSPTLPRVAFPLFRVSGYREFGTLEPPYILAIPEMPKCR